MQLYGIFAYFMQLYGLIADFYAIIPYNYRHFCNYFVYLQFSTIKWNEHQLFFK